MDEGSVNFHWSHIRGHSDKSGPVSLRIVMVA